MNETRKARHENLKSITIGCSSTVAT